MAFSVGPKKRTKVLLPNLFYFLFFFLVLRVNLLRRYFISVCFFFLIQTTIDR
jgi:hypothetical protein